MSPSRAQSPAQSPSLRAPEAAASRQNKDFPRLVLLNMACFCDPWEMLELARVNKTWYEAFTSDDAWRDWDAYSVETGICSHYLGFRDCEQDGWDLKRNGLRSLPKNLYYRLCAYRTYRTYGYGMGQLRPGPINYPFAKLLAKRPLNICPSFKNFLPSVVEDEELVIELLKMGVQPDGLPNCYKKNRRAALASIGYRALNGYYAGSIDVLFRSGEDQGEEPTFFYKAFKDDVEFAMDAIERDPACYEILADVVQDNMQVCDRWIELLHLQLPTACAFTDREHPWVPTPALSEKSRAIKLVSLYPTLLTYYASLCRDGKIEADEDVVFAALDKDVEGVIEYEHIPPALTRQKEFFVKLPKWWRWNFPWESMPLYLRFDREVLASIVKALQQRRQDWEDRKVYPDHEDRPDLECVAALFLCEYPLDINKDMDTLLEILSLPVNYLYGCKKAYSRIPFDDLARHLLAMVGVKYGPCSKRPRLQ